MPRLFYFKEFLEACLGVSTLPFPLERLNLLQTDSGEAK